MQSSASQLESSLLETTTAGRTNLLKIQTLSATVASLESDKEYLTTELDKGRQEWAASRHDSHAQLVRLQSDLDASRTEHAHATQSLAALRTAHDALKARHEDSAASLATTKAELAANEAAFAAEMGQMRRLVELTEAREADRQKRVEAIDAGLEEERQARDDREQALAGELGHEREQRDRLEVEVAELRAAIERGVAWDGAEVGDRSLSLALSPSGILAAKGQKGGRSYAEVYGDYVRMQDELARERAETRRLGECLNQILVDVEERVSE